MAGSEVGTLDPEVLAVRTAYPLAPVSNPVVQFPACVHVANSIRAGGLTFRLSSALRCPYWLKLTLRSAVQFGIVLAEVCGLLFGIVLAEVGGAEARHAAVPDA